eukprot:Sspe_Gene.112648::Locus_95786_Transcript_1_1_Confidence_1.000_Length_1009::g.112648::m.112648
MVGGMESTILQPPPATTPPRGYLSRVLIVGCDYPGSGLELHGCAEASRAVIPFLKRNGQTQCQARLLVDDGSGEHPTKHNILSGLRALVRDLRPREHVLVTFAGRRGDEDSMMLPCDYAVAGPIMSHEVHEVLAALPPHARLTFVCDFNVGGTLLDLPYKLSAVRDPQSGQMLLRFDAPSMAQGTTQEVVVVSSTATVPLTDRLMATGGSLLTAFITALNLNAAPLCQQLLADIWHVMRQQHGEMCPVPRLSCSKMFRATDIFEWTAQQQPPPALPRSSEVYLPPHDVPPVVNIPPPPPPAPAAPQSYYGDSHSSPSPPPRSSSP